MRTTRNCRADASDSQTSLRRRRLLCFALAELGVATPAWSSAPAGIHATAMQGYNEEPFTFDGETRRVFRKGETGPAVVVLHELPGLTPETVSFADWLVSQNFHVVMPLLFGEPGQSFNKGLALSSLVCLRREFHCWLGGQSSPMTNWLRALGRDAHRTRGGKGIGVIGMCLTGGFAMIMMGDESVLAPVTAQPSLPFLLADQLDLDRQALDEAAARSDRAPLLGLRFEQDWRCGPERFAAIGAAFARQPPAGRERFKQVVVPGRGHSTLVYDYEAARTRGVDTRQRVLDHLNTQLR